MRPRKGTTMNAKNALQQTYITIRKLTIERDAARMAAKVEAAKVIELNKKIAGIRKLATDTAGDANVILHMIAELTK